MQDEKSGCGPELYGCAEEVFGWYRSESLIRFDEAVTAGHEDAKAILEQVYIRMNDCKTYESLFCGNHDQTLPQYLAAHMPKEDVDCFFRLLHENQITQIPDDPAAVKEADASLQRRICLEQLADHFIRWDALDLLDHVLADDEKEPGYSAITASKMLELGRQLQIMLYGMHIPDLASFLSLYGYNKNVVRRLYSRCEDEERRFGDHSRTISLSE